MAELKFHTKKDLFTIQVSKEEGDWLGEILQIISASNSKKWQYQEVKDHFEQQTSEDFEPFWYGKQMNVLRDFGLLVL